MNRFDRIVALLVLLQTRRQLTGAELAARFDVSLRTIYRDLRALEQAGVPLYAEAGAGYSLAEGYRLPPVHFSREEATALFTAEKLAARHADPATTTRLGQAMDKLRAVLRRSDRDFLTALTPHVHIVAGRSAPGPLASADYYQPLLTAVAARRVVRLHYRAGHDGTASARDIEPIGIYYGQNWHVVGYCRLRQAFRDFRLDRIAGLCLPGEQFAERPETLHSYWAALAARASPAVAVVRFTAAAAGLARETRQYQQWKQERVLPSGEVEMTFVPPCLDQFARWLLPWGRQVAVREPASLQLKMAAAARELFAHFNT